MSTNFYEDAFPVGAPSPLDAILPPASCPQACPHEVQLNLCTPQAGPNTNSDAFGDPEEFIPPGVRTMPEWTPVGVKNGTGGTTLVGPAGQFVFPSPMLSSAPRGPVVPAGESVGLPGAISDPGPATAGLFGRIPWWGYAIGAVILVKVMGK